MQNEAMGTEVAPPKKGEHLHLGGKKQEFPDVSGMQIDLNALSTRLRLIEEGFTNLRRLSQITEENLISKGKHYQTEFKTLTSDITEMRKEIAEIKDKLLLVISELGTLAKKDDVKVLEKYISFWNPLRFVTHGEVEEVVTEILNKQQK